LAIGVLVTCLCGAMGVAAVAIGLQPTRNTPYGFFRTAPRSVRGLFSAILLSVVVAITYIDRTLYLGHYAEAHIALRVGAVWSLMFAILIAAGARNLFCWTKLRLAAAALMVIAPVFLLRDNDADTAYAFGIRPYPSLVLHLARRPFDVDGDGYASVLGDGDCAPFNPAIHPGAREIPGNGIDENCIAGDGVRPVVWAQPDRVPIPSDASPLNVILITVDALRPDHLGVYNPAYGPGGRGTTPELDRWAADAVVFNHAYASGAWTGISFGSLMRGLYPRRLHWTTYYEGNLAPLRLFRKPLENKLRPNEKVASAFLFASNDRHYPLAWWLRRRGMWTVAVVDDGFTQVLSPSIGIDKGFSSYRNTKGDYGLTDNDFGTAALAIRTLKTLRKSPPFFLWIHFFGTHGPSKKHPGIPDYGAGIADQYDHEIRFFDRNFGLFISAIDAHPARSNTAVFLASDHGEAIYSKGRRHGFGLSEEDLRVALIAKVPGWKAQRVNYLASLVDLMPTIMGLTHTPTPTPLDGIDLGKVVSGSLAIHQRILISDTWRLRRDGQIAVDMTAAYNGNDKLILKRLSGTVSLCDQRVLAEPCRLVYVRSRNRLSQALWEYIETTGGPPMIDE